MMHMTNNKINFKILVPIFLMAIISIVTIYSALTYTSKSLGNLALKQAVWYIVGSILVIILLRVKNSFLQKGEPLNVCLFNCCFGAKHRAGF